MIIQAINNTAGILTYANESVTIPANSTVTLPTGILNTFAVDPQVNSDINLGKLSLSDTVTTYPGTAAINFLLNFIALTIPSTVTGFGTIAALNREVDAFTQGASVVSFNITGVWVATLTLEATDGDGTWHIIPGFIPADGTFTSATQSNIFLIVGCAGFTQVRLRASAFTSGTVSVSWSAGIGTSYVNQGVPAGNAAAWPVKLTDGTNSGSFTAAGEEKVVVLDKIASGTLGALNATVSITTNDTASGTVLLAGAFVGTVVAEGSVDGVNFVNIPLYNISTNGPIFNAGVSLQDHYALVAIAGFVVVRMRVSAYTSGSFATTLNLSEALGYPIITPITQGTFTDNSGHTSGTINTSTLIMAANPSRRYLFIQNVDTVTMWINFTSAATTSEPSIQLVAGASFVMESAFVSTEAINVISTIATKQYTAKQA